MSHSVSEAQTVAQVHGHYLVAVPGGDGPWPLLVGFHGYGETARDHLEKLLQIPGVEGWLVCAVQGLSAFYRGRTGEVVASWMTRLGRELAIEDNRRYVADVVTAVRDAYSTTGVLVYAGFSQGVAMAYRAAAAPRHRPGGLLALAGDVPPEITDAELARLPSVLIGQGDRDEWYDASKLAVDRARLEAAGVAVEPCVFAGGHEWGGAFLERAGGYLARAAQPTA